MCHRLCGEKKLSDTSSDLVGPIKGACKHIRGSWGCCGIFNYHHHFMVRDIKSVTTQFLIGFNKQLFPLHFVLWTKAHPVDRKIT